MLSTEVQTDLGEITLACGYYDQSHLAHEFADFTGQSPSLYRAHLLEKRASPPPNLVQFLQAQ
jgi:AraC-like DNA-binding protein